MGKEVKKPVKTLADKGGVEFKRVYPKSPCETKSKLIAKKTNK